MQIPINVPDSVESNKPINLSTIYTCIGELYLQNQIRLQTLHEDAQNAITQLQQSLTDAKNELSVVKKKLADLEGK